MKARAGISWQLILADLALILFMVTAGALSRATTREAHAAAAAKAAGANAAGAAGASAQGPPLAIYREAPGAPPLARWLATQPADPRQQLTIVSQYPPGGQAAALARARDRVAALGTAGAQARVVIEPGTNPVTATLAYDAGPSPALPAPDLAQGLQSSGASITR